MKKAFFNYTGYGKTKIVLDYISEHPEIKRVLIISKGDIIKESWPNEINKWSFPFTYTYITGELNNKQKLERVYGLYDILGVTPSLLGWFTENKFFKLTKKELRYDLVIFDESDLFKNSQTQRFKNVKKWIAKIPNVFILTATPTPNTIEDLWSQIYLIDEPPYRLGKNITAFRKEYGEEVKSGDRYLYYYLPSAVNTIIETVKDMCEVNLIKPKDLYPQPKIRIIKINPDEETAKILAKLEKDYVVEIDKEIISASNYNKVLTKLQQIGNGFIYRDDGTPIYLNDIKLRYVEKQLKETLDPVLVTYSFIPDKERLLALPGSKLITSEDEWNENKIKLGVIYSNKAGLNLQKSRCKKIIWYTPTWDARAWEQTNSRVIRRGLMHTVTIDVLIVKGSIDDLIYERMKEKLKFMINTFKPLETPKGALKLK
jgi:SNF2 family DNA or RNA helicase